MGGVSKPVTARDSGLPIAGMIFKGNGEYEVGVAHTWSSIERSAAKREVKRLQMRIAKAVEEGRWGRVKALQHLLTHSFHAKKADVLAARAAESEA